MRILGGDYQVLRVGSIHRKVNGLRGERGGSGRE